MAIFTRFFLCPYRNGRSLTIDLTIPDRINENIAFILRGLLSKLIYMIGTRVWERLLLKSRESSVSNPIESRDGRQEKVFSSLRDDKLLHNIEWLRQIVLIPCVDPAMATVGLPNDSIDPLRVGWILGVTRD
jgi:hypothetical protein